MSNKLADALWDVEQKKLMAWKLARDTWGEQTENGETETGKSCGDGKKNHRS